jgi:hypothetical protein
VTAAGAWCVAVESRELSPGRLVAHWFEEMPYQRPALRLTSVCGGKFMLRRRPKRDECLDRCPTCVEKGAPSS